MSHIFRKTKKISTGFTLVELMVAIAIIGILCLIAIPTFTAWLPDYRLKQAARDLYGNLQRARMGAIKANDSWGVYFDNSLKPGRYLIYSLGPDRTWNTADDVLQITIDLSAYKGVDYGHGKATRNVPLHPFGPGDDIGYKSPDRVAVFSNRGTVDNGSNESYVYLSNTNGTAYAVGTPNPAGVVVLRKYTGGNWK